MKIKDLKVLLNEMVQKKVQVTPMLWGPHGIGKSASVRQVAKDLGYDLFNVILSQKEAVDLAGVLYTREDKDLKLSVTDAHPPKWFADACKKGKFILFLDEFNMARKEVMNAAFELVLDRRLNNIKLPDDVFIVCAGNPDDERYDVTPMSESLRDRLMHIMVEADLDSWFDYAKSAKISPDVVQFLRNNPQAASIMDKRDLMLPVEIKHSLRSWERLSDIQKLNLPQRVKQECYSGIVGTEMALLFVKSSDEKVLSPEDILEMSDETVELIQSYLEGDNIRFDKIEMAIENLGQWVRASKANMKSANANIMNYIKFALMLPKDLVTSALTMPLATPAFKLDKETASRFGMDISRGDSWANVYLKVEACKKVCEEVQEAREATQKAVASSESATRKVKV
jgi:MoxR-like ATPase